MKCETTATFCWGNLFFAWNPLIWKNNWPISKWTIFQLIPPIVDYKVLVQSQLDTIPLKTPKWGRPRKLKSFIAFSHVLKVVGPPPICGTITFFNVALYFVCRAYLLNSHCVYAYFQIKLVRRMWFVTKLLQLVQQIFRFLVMKLSRKYNFDF